MVRTIVSAVSVNTAVRALVSASLNREDQLIFALFSPSGPGPVNLRKQSLPPASISTRRSIPAKRSPPVSSVDFGKRRIYDKGRAGILRNIDLLVSPQRRVGQRNARFAREKPRPVSFDLEIERVFHRLGLPIPPAKSHSCASAEIFTLYSTLLTNGTSMICSS